jgi:hypothetical protein
MEDIRSYRIEEEAKQRNDEDRREYGAAPDDEVPFHIPRD